MSVACPYPHAERCTFPPSRCLEKEPVTPSLSSHRLSPLSVFTYRSGWSGVARACVLAVLKKRVPLSSHLTSHRRIFPFLRPGFLWEGGTLLICPRGTSIGIDFLTVVEQICTATQINVRSFLSLVNLLSDTCLVVFDSRETPAQEQQLSQVDTPDLENQIQSISTLFTKSRMRHFCPFRKSTDVSCLRSQG